jgi:exonuclease SbcC
MDLDNKNEKIKDLMAQLEDYKNKLKLSNKKIENEEREWRIKIRNYKKELKLKNTELELKNEEIELYKEEYSKKELENYRDKMLKQIFKKKLEYYIGKVELKNKELKKYELMVFNKNIVIDELQKIINGLSKIKDDDMEKLKKSKKSKKLINSLREELKRCDAEIECKNKELEECKEKISDQSIEFNKYKKEADNQKKTFFEVIIYDDKWNGYDTSYLKTNIDHVRIICLDIIKKMKYFLNEIFWDDDVPDTVQFDGEKYIISESEKIFYTKMINTTYKSYEVMNASDIITHTIEMSKTLVRMWPHGLEQVVERDIDLNVINNWK